MVVWRDDDTGGGWDKRTGRESADLPAAGWRNLWRKVGVSRREDASERDAEAGARARVARGIRRCRQNRGLGRDGGAASVRGDERGGANCVFASRLGKRAEKFGV